MLPAQTQNNHLAMEEVKGLFDQWRRNRKHRDPIPPSLWDAAISLAKSYSLYEISRSLRLSYNDLKARMQKPSIVSPAFIELAGIASAEYTVEMEKPSGERMRVKGQCTITELIRTFFQ